MFDCGAATLGSVKSLPEGPGALGRAIAPLYYPLQRQFATGGWLLAGFPGMGHELRAGHIYGVMLGNGQKYAVVQAVEVVSQDPLTVVLGFKFQPDGTPRF